MVLASPQEDGYLLSKIKSWFPEYTGIDVLVKSVGPKSRRLKRTMSLAVPLGASSGVKVRHLTAVLNNDVILTVLKLRRLKIDNRNRSYLPTYNTLND